MTAENLVEKLKQALDEGLLAAEIQPGGRVFVDIRRGAVRPAAAAVSRMGGRYQVSIGYDQPGGQPVLGLIHAFAFDREGLLVKLRTHVSRENAEVASITPDLPGAGWSERENQDLLGFRFVGHPKSKRLVLSDDFPADIFPLRKEVPWNLMPPAAEDVAYQLDEAPPGTSVVPIGPFHPTLHEPAHFAVYVDGETVKGCDYRGFMTHRGIEKLCQTQVTYNEIPFIAERICGICGSVHSTAYAQAVEHAAGVRVPDRARFIRTIMLEIERLHSHLLWIGVAGHLIGFDTIFMHAWRIREPIMWLAERITGNRKTYGMVTVGGVRRDLTPELGADIRGVISQVETEVRGIEKAIRGDTAIHKRTRGVGFVSTKDARHWNLVGPVARARGVDIDSRRDFPYAAYPELSFEVPVFDDGDVWATLLVRIIEIYQAVSLIRQALDRMPDGPLLAELNAPIPSGRHAVSCVEAPRGESVHYVITGEEDRPDRWRVRAPTYPNLQGIPLMVMENQLADVPIIIGSIDPCFSCTDRVTVLDLRSGRGEVLNRRQFEQLAKGGRC